MCTIHPGGEDTYQGFQASAESQSLQTAARASLPTPYLCLRNSALLINGLWSNAPSAGYWEAALAPSPAALSTTGVLQPHKSIS